MRLSVALGVVLVVMVMCLVLTVNLRCLSKGTSGVSIGVRIVIVSSWNIELSISTLLWVPGAVFSFLVSNVLSSVNNILIHAEIWNKITIREFNLGLLWWSLVPWGRHLRDWSEVMIVMMLELDGIRTREEDCQSEGFDVQHVFIKLIAKIN